MIDVHVQDVIDKVYNGCYYNGQKSVLENACYADAVKQLEPEDRELVEGVAKMFDHSKPNSKNGVVRLHNFGKASALELLAKLGMFFNETNYKAS